MTLLFAGKLIDAGEAVESHEHVKISKLNTNVTLIVQQAGAVLYHLAKADTSEMNSCRDIKEKFLVLTYWL